MELYQALQQRRTIRDFEQIDGHPRVIDQVVVTRIISAGFLAPTNDHMRDWHFVTLADPDVRRSVLAEVISPISRKQSENLINGWGLTHPDQREMYLDAIPKQFSMLMDCGCLLLPLYRQPLPLLKPKDLSALNYFASIWLCIGNLLNAASAEGIFGVIRIPGEEESKIVKSRLGIPEYYEFPCWLALGYPSSNAISARQVDIRLDERIHQNRWGDSF